jgi:uncharacterized membrane protein
VERAPSLGLKATAGQGELEDLEALEAEELPAILHFQSGSQSGFGLLEAVSPAFHLWDSQRGRHAVTREELATRWSGVVVLLERQGPGQPEAGYLRHRVREFLLEDGKLKTELAGPSASGPVRAGLAVLLGLVLVLAVLSQPPGLRLLTAGVAALVTAGLAASWAALTWTHGGKASFLCGGGGPLDCQSVLLSPWAHPAGVPLAGLGTAFFGGLLLLLCTLALGGGPAPLWLVSAAFLPTLPLSALLVLLQVRMRRFCTLCMGVHVVDVTGAAIFLLAVWPAWPAPPPGLLSSVLLLALFFGLLLSALVPHLSRGDEDAALVHEHVRLLSSPLATLAQLSLAPRLALDGEALGPHLGASTAPHVLVVLAHPACSHCGHLLDELEALLSQQGEQLRAHIALAPMDPDDARDAAACEALAAAGVAWGGPLFLQLFRAAKQDSRRLLEAADPLALVAADAGQPLAALTQARERARARVQAAATLKQQHARGLPTVFLDGRRCEAPLAHVATWIEQPALRDLLPPAGAPTP